MTGDDLLRKLQSMSPEDRGRIVLIETTDDDLAVANTVTFAKNGDERAIVITKVLDIS